MTADLTVIVLQTRDAAAAEEVVRNATDDPRFLPPVAITGVVVTHDGAAAPTRGDQ